MTREEFEALRSLPNKRIQRDIKFSRKQGTSPAFTADDIPIENSLGLDARLYLGYNPENGYKKINVAVKSAGGAICRLEVDGPTHPGVGRDHKHSLLRETCPARGMQADVVARPELAGKGPEEVFRIFCEDAKIEFDKAFVLPQEARE